MALQTSGTITIGDLRTEFGDTGSSSLSEFYRGGSLVPNTGTNAAVPTSGTISLSDFYGAAAVAQSWQWVQTYTSMGEGVTRTFHQYIHVLTHGCTLCLVWFGVQLQISLSVNLSISWILPSLN